MKRYIIFSAVIFFAACNNSDNGSSTTSDSTDKKMSDTTHQMTTTNDVPPLPAVPANAKVYFKNLRNGATVSSPVKVEMAIDNMKVDTAGPVVASSGHFHILVDAEDSIAIEQMVPKDSTHLHYGKGQTSAELPLTPGKHKLVLQFADGLHRSYGSKLANSVTITVKK
jgi:hypothetical protein